MTIVDEWSADYPKPCTTCQAVPPPPSREQGTKPGPGEHLSINLQQVGEHFIDDITEVKQDSIVEVIESDRIEDSNQLLQDILFKETIRGWSHRDQEHRVTTLLNFANLQNEPMSKRMTENQDLILLPVTWWSLSMDTLEPNEL